MEYYSTPAIGYFNDDDVPDFLVKYQTGPGFPIYYYSEVSHYYHYQINQEPHLY